jgi:dienelactone hydrolase
MTRAGKCSVILLLVLLSNRATPADVHEGVERFTSGDAKVSLDYFRPAAPGKFPAVFLLHGSGGLDPGTAYVFREIGRDLAGQGYVVLIPHYFERAGHEAGQPFKDKAIMSMYDSVQDAVDFAVANAPIDSDRIGMVGYSHLG